jgi:uncharacterized membrane protein YhaH (DUF805 family)
METNYLPWAFARVLLSLSFGAFIVGRYEKMPLKDVFARLGRLCAAALVARGTVSRAWFVYAGVALAVLKTTIDTFVRRVRADDLVDNWLTAFPTDLAGVQAMLPTIWWSVPFIWIGTGLCVMRLRDAGMPRILVPIFFIPAVNILFFIICSSIPSVVEERSNTLEERSRSFFSRMLPQTDFGIAAFAILQCSLIGVLGVLAGAYGVGNYGAPLFLGLPFFMGFLSVLLYGVHKRRTLKECIGIAWLSMFLTACALVCLLIEGIVCIAVLFPLGVVLATMGAIVGYSLFPSEGSGRIQSSVLCGLALAVGLALPVPSSPTLTSVTKITVNRSPQEVWPHVIAFSEISPPKEWLFLQGVAYPIRARIEGQGVGAIRYCEFSTGPFIEPITVWNEPHELRFSVTETPPALTEFNPLGTVIAPHLDGYFESLGGQFLLREIRSGVTEIQATTWYTHKVAPVWYWELISDPILHLIHKRVLEHIKTEAERV